VALLTRHWQNVLYAGTSHVLVTLSVEESQFLA